MVLTEMILIDTLFAGRAHSCTARRHFAVEILVTTRKTFGDAIIASLFMAPEVVVPKPFTLFGRRTSGFLAFNDQLRHQTLNQLHFGGREI
jgi:hypothetical protein